MARRLLAQCTSDGEPILGDLEEVHATRRQRSGWLASGLWFWREVALACWYGMRDAWSERWPTSGGLLTLGAPTHTIRALCRRPGYALTILSLMAVASGSISVLAGIARSMSGEADPALDAVQVIVGTDSERGWNVAYVSPPELEDLRRGVDGLEELGIFQPDATVGLAVADEVLPVNVIFADAAYFRILRASTELGTVFTEAEGRGDEGPRAILSRELWRDAFASDPDIVGGSVRIAGRTFQVQGVMARSFRDAGRGRRTDLWLPLGEVPAFHGPGALTTRPARWALAVARIEPRSMAGVRAGTRRVAADLARRYPNLHRGRGFAFRDLRSWWFGPVRRPMRVALTGGSWLLVLVLGNIAALFRMRRQEREAELALRAALGARRGSLLRVGVAEAAILAAGSAALGLLVACALLRAGGVRAVLGLPYLASPRVDIAAVVGCSALIIPVALLVGSGSPVVRTGTGRGPTRWLLAAEGLLAAALLTVAGALVQDARAVAHTATGYEPRGLLTARLDLTLATTDPSVAAFAGDERTLFAESFMARAAALPGVESAALVAPGVLGNAQAHVGFVPQGMDPTENLGRWLAQRILITPGGLETLGITVRAGRGLAWSDRDTSLPVAVVDERIAQRFWPSGDALGRRFCPDGPCRAPVTVVGIAETAKNRGRERPDEGIVGDVYLPYPISPSASGTIAVRADGTDADLAREVTALIADLAPDAVISDIRWMDDRLGADEFVHRATASLVAAYALLAALLALVGTYGLVAVRLGRTWRDTALRMALGARWSVLARGVVVEGVMPTAVGILPGAAAGLLLAPRLASQVSQVAGIGMWSSADSVLVSALLISAAACAAALPVLKLGGLRPMEVLRAD